MKMALAERPIERIATSTTESQFTIKATGKAFKILSSGLYKEKVLAIVRELSCNAYDAHIAVGTPERPFDVHLPNAMEPFFSVRDYGPSLSPDQIGPVYTTYFESTKTDSNELIGGLGLGSKSPFCYVDSFTVIARFEGMRRTYTCFFDESDTPSLLLMNEEPSDEETGLEVKLPVRSTNFGEFCQKAMQVYKHFGTPPNVVGNPDYKLDKSDIILVGDGYILRDERGRQSNAMMGVVAYPIDTQAVSGLNYDQERFLNSSALDIEFDIGDLDITAGREELSYDPRTQEAIVRRVTEVMTDITDRIVKRMAECKNEFEARIFYGRLVAFGFVLTGFPQQAVPYKGKIIRANHWSLELDKEFPGLSILKYSQISSYGRSSTRYDVYSGQNWRPQDKLFIMASRDLVMIEDDIGGRFMTGRIREFRENNPNAVVFVVRREEIVHKPVDPKLVALPGTKAAAAPVVPDLTDYIAKLKDTLDGVEFLKLSELPRPQPQPRNATSVSVLQDYYRSSSTYPHNLTRNAWKAVASPDPQSEGVYIGTVSGSIVRHDGEREENFGSFYREIIQQKLWADKDIFYSIPKSLVKPYVDSDKWVNLYDLVIDKLKAEMTDPVWLENASRQRALDNLLCQFPDLSSEHSLVAAIGKNLDREHPWAKFAAQWAEAKKGQGAYAKLRLAERLGIAPRLEFTRLSDSWIEMKNRYPLISYLFQSYRNRDEAKMARQFVDYINGIDGTNCQG